jgi:hypothetical protein
VPAIDFLGAIAPGETVTLTVQYFSRTRSLGKFVPKYLITELQNPGGGVGDGKGTSPRQVSVMANHSVLVQFSTIANRSYQVQYTDEGALWRLSPASFKAGANIVNWIDYGPPATLTVPAIPVARKYRIREVLTTK